MSRMIPLFAALLVGCGIPDDTLMSDLEEGDVEKICEEIVVEERSVTCELEGFEFTVDIGGSVDECVDDNDPSYYEGCDVTVGDVRDCSDGWNDLSDEDLCSGDTEYPAACDPLFECAFSG